MTPDELRALPPAERLPHLRSLYLAFLDWPEDDPAPNFEGRISLALLALDAADGLARDHADLREWAAKAAGVLRAMLSTLGDYATVEEMNETRFADLRGYMVEAETGLLEALLAEHAERWGNT